MPFYAYFFSKSRYMTFTTALQTSQMTFAISADEMTTSVLLVERWLVQQQLFKQQQGLIEKREKELEALKKENLQLSDELDKLKKRSSQNSSVPPSQDLLKKPSDKSKRKKGKKRGPKYNHIGKTRNGFGEPDRIEQLWRICAVREDGVGHV